MKIKVEFNKGVDEHELGEIKEIWYKFSDLPDREQQIELTDIDGRSVTYWMSDILMLSVEE